MSESGSVRVVLVVATDRAHLDLTARILRTAGHQVTEATSFAEGRERLASLQPDVLIADIQLDAYNGLQLVWQRHFDQPGRPSIVTNAYADSVLEAEANRLGCPYLITPVQPEELLAVIGSLGDVGRVDVDDQRRWPRRGVGRPVTVEVEHGPATLIDVSYGGCRLRLGPALELTLDRPVSLSIPTLGAVVPGTPVWRRPTAAGSVYGLSIGRPGAAETWRHFVDTVARV